MLLALSGGKVLKEGVQNFGKWRLHWQVVASEGEPEATCGCGSSSSLRHTLHIPKAEFRRLRNGDAPSFFPAPGDGWLGPVAVENNTSYSNVSPELDVDQYGNLWAATLDLSTSPQGVDLYYSTDDGATWNYLGTLTIGSDNVYDFGFKIDRGTGLLHFSITHYGYWSSDTLCTPDVYCSGYGNWHVCTWWEADDEYASRVVTLQVNYSGGVPQGASIVGDNIVEDGLYIHRAYYQLASADGCSMYIYDTLWPWESWLTDIAFEREEATDYGFAFFGYDLTHYASTQYWVYPGNLYSNQVDSIRDSTYVLLSRSTDGGNSWTGFSSAQRLLASSGPYSPIFWVMDAFASDADAPAVHFTVAASNATAYYLRSVDRGANWSSYSVSLSHIPNQVSVAQGYGTDYVLWLVEDSSVGVRAFYSADRGASWASQYTFSDPNYGMPSVYPDGEEDLDATSTTFFLTLYKGGNALFRQAPVSNANELGDWTTPQGLDSLAINTSSAAYPAYWGVMDMDEIAFVWGGEYVPGIAWVKANGGQGDIWFTRPTESLGMDASESAEEPVRLLGGLRGELVFSGPVIGKTLRLYDAAGRLVLERRLSGRRLKVNLPAGVYHWALGEAKGKVVLK